MENQENTIINERKHCPKCGKENSIDNDFCFYCGNIFNQENKMIIKNNTNEKSVEKKNINVSSPSLNNENIITTENQKNLITTEGKYCEKCSFKNDTNSSFCSNCGNNFNQENKQETNLKEEITKKNIVLVAIETLFRTIGILIWNVFIILLILFGTCFIFAGL